VPINYKLGVFYYKSWIDLVNAKLLPVGTAGIKIVQQAILRFVVPQRRHYSLPWNLAPRWSILPQKIFEVLWLRNYWSHYKIVRKSSSIIMQSLVEIRRCTAAWEWKVWNFCLFVTLWILNMNKGLAHQRCSHSNSDIRHLSVNFDAVSALFRGRNALSKVWKDIWTMRKVGPHIS